ncbi:MAG: DUF58 domain-containing protein [Dehalococcoidia bacterium]|nr:DUF58 domain-containing protein [Dehalococcoidia bacterium]
MKNIPGWVIPLLKLYVAAVFIFTAVVSPLALSFIPVLLALAYLFVWWRPPSVNANLVADLFAFFAISLLLSQVIPVYFAVLASVPLLVLVTRDLEVTAETLPSPVSNGHRSLTKLGAGMLMIGVLTLLVGVLLNSQVLMASAGAATLYFLALHAIVMMRIPGKPVDVDPVHERIVAGTRETLYINMLSKTKLGGNLVLKSPYEWLTIQPDVIPLTDERFDVEVTITPPLSGPSSIMLEARVLDRWGLTSTRFELAPITLHVIPRARYAEWLAKRYLTESHMGMLPLISTLGAIRPLYGLRIGVEYYGSQLYQPGDSLKNIDWKHSIKYNKLISKEFAEFRGQPAIMLVNLAVGNAEEADKQAYNVVVAALSLSKEQIPTAIAAYDQDDVEFVTSTMPPSKLVARALEVIPQIKIIGKPVKYLGRPDIMRLRANIQRLQYVDSPPARVLAELLRVEYASLKGHARLSPATRALTLAFERTGTPQSTVVVISLLNHDTEAVLFIASGYGTKGNATLVVEEAAPRKR